MADIIKFKHTGQNSRGTFEYRQERARNYLAEHNYERIRMRKALKDYRRAVNKLDLESLMNAQWTDHESSIDDQWIILLGENASKEARMSLDYIDECIKEQTMKMDNNINSRILVPNYLSIDWDDIYAE